LKLLFFEKPPWFAMPNLAHISKHLS